MIAAVATDKAQLLQNRPTSIRGDSGGVAALAQQFAALSEQWTEKQANVVQTIEQDGKNSIRIDCTASIESKTGVEMEALTGASVAALTVYDMCKALSHDIVIRDLQLISKTGGKRDFNREA